MLSPVILVAEQAFREAGWATLGFNFRGVGGSQGSHGEGRDEADDVSGALDELARQLSAPGEAGPGSAAGPSSEAGRSPGGTEPDTRPPPGLAVAGYSFGSAVGGRVAVADARVSFYLGIAPPVDHYDFSFLREARGPVALVMADRDRYASAARRTALLAELPRRPWLRVVAGADHFFAGVLDGLAAACGQAIEWEASGAPAP
jgi:alpha/beta superfamily hydrolase